MSAVLVPADESARVSEDLLGEQDRPSGEGDGRGGTDTTQALIPTLNLFSDLSEHVCVFFIISDKQHEGQI